MLGQLDTFIAFAVVILGVSLLITVLNQAVVALLSLRGTNLLWGLQTLIECVHPELKKHSKEIGEAVLRHPLISDSTYSRLTGWPVVRWLIARWKLASAIRVEELTEILGRLAESKGSQPWKKELAELLRKNRDQQQERRAAALATAVALMAQPGSQALPAPVSAHVSAQLQRAVGDLDLWFGSIMDRVSQRFAAQMRAWTVVFAIIVAFALHLDASDLFRQIQADPQLRARLGASTEAMTQHAEQVLTTAAPDAAASALRRLQAESTELKGLTIPPDAATRAGARSWIRQQSLPGDREVEMLARLEALIGEETREVLGELRTTAAGIDETLRAAGLRLIPDYTTHHPGVRPDWWAASGPGRDHLFGILFSAMLLSLGAPFWFSVLKSAATLRPVIASKESAERAQQRS